MKNKTDLDPMATPEGLAERFDRPVVHYPTRVLSFDGDKAPDDRPGMEGKERYVNVRYLVQANGIAGFPEIKWMAIAEWRSMVGMVAA